MTPLRDMSRLKEEQVRLREQQGLRIIEREQRVKERVKDRLPKNLARMEARLAKLERRVKKIEEHPDPAKPAANKLLYKAQAKEIRGLIEAWKTGNPPFAGVFEFPGEEMGFAGWGGVFESDKATDEEAKKYFAFMERQGFNANSCDRIIVTLPQILSGDYPAPEVMVTTNFECFPGYLVMISLAQLLGIPLLSIDRPPVFDERALAYVTHQIEEVIDYLETMFPGHKFNEDLLIEQQEVQRIWWGYQRDIYQLLKRKPCPVAGFENFRELVPPEGFGESLYDLLEYRRLYRDQLYEKAERGNVPSKIWGTEEKLRLCWAVSGVYYYDVFTFLDKLGVSVPCWLVSDFTEKQAGREPVIGDETQFGRKLKPLEEVARAMKHGWGDRSDYYVNSIITSCRELELDGIVYFKQAGCSPTWALGGIVSQRAERELGIPTLELEGRQIDQRGFNERDLLSKLVDFCNVCLAGKHLPPLTKKELDKAGFDNPSQYRIIK